MVPGAESSNADDYKRLLEGSQPWWTLLRLFKIHQFDNNSLALEVPKEFCPSAMGKEESQGMLGVSTHYTLVTDAQENIPERCRVDINSFLRKCLYPTNLAAFCQSVVVRNQKKK